MFCCGKLQTVFVGSGNSFFCSVFLHSNYLFATSDEKQHVDIKMNLVKEDRGKMK